MKDETPSRSFSHSAGCTLVSSHQPSPHSFHLSLCIFSSFELLDETRLVCSHQLPRILLLPNRAAVGLNSLQPENFFSVYIQGIQAKPECCILFSQSPSILRKDSFQITRWRCHRRSKRSRLWNGPIQKKGQNGRTSSTRCFKANQKPSEQAMFITFTKILLLVFWHYNICVIPCSSQLLFLFHLSVMLHSVHI